MKYSLILFAVTAFATPHGPDEDIHVAPNPKSAAKPAPAAPAKAAGPQKIKTPPGCKALANDVDWPTEAEWKKTFPNLVLRPKNLAQGVGRPDYKVRARTYEDVVATVKFAAEKNIRLSVITSGHDFLGRNDAPSGLVIDNSMLQGIKVHESFTPSALGAEKPPSKANVIKPVAGKQAAVTFGVGVSTQMLNDALSPSKLVTVGAAHGSVAPAGGYGQTAGHSPISTIYGLCADQFLEFKVVTPDGQLRVANKAANPDLFWALRGGGGSTFGVVVEATMKAHPDIPVTYTTWQINTTKENGDGMWDAYAELHHHFTDFVDNKSMSGFYYIYPNRMTGGFLHLGQGAGKTKAEAIWAPLIKKLTSYPDLNLTKLVYDEYPTFKAYFDARFGAIDKEAKPGEAKPKMPWDEARRMIDDQLEKRHDPGEHMTEPVPAAMAILDSRLLGAKHFEHKNLTQILKAAAPFALGGQQAILQGHLVSGGKAWKPDDDTAVLPAWRSTYVHLIGYNVPGKVSVDSLRTLAPETGAYANEAFAHQPDWKNAMWGKNYPKLSELKTKYDPQGLLWVTPGINADEYEAREGRVCKRTTKYTANTPPESDNPNRGRVMKGSIN